MAEFRTLNLLPKICDDVEARIKAHPGSTVIWFGYPYTHWVDVLRLALISRGLCLDYIIDNDRKKWGRVSAGGVIVSPPEHVISSHRENALVFVLSDHKNAIVEQLMGFGLKASQIESLPMPDEYTKEADKLFLPETAGMRQMNLRELQLCELDILKELKSFCDRRGLRYYLAGGTCFGAAHYKGFVPWDDDIDVYLPYEDYMTLIRQFPQGGRFELLSWEKDSDYFWPYAQMVDNSTRMIYGSLPVSAFQGVFIDIVPLTGFPADEDELRYRFDSIRYLESKWYPYYFARGVEGVDVADEREKTWRQKYNLPFDGSENAAEALEFGRGDEPWVLPRKAYDGIHTLEFEGESFCVIGDWREYLKRRYKNYQDKPQKVLEIPHPIKAYWK